MKLSRILCTLFIVFSSAGTAADDVPRPLGVPLGATVEQARAILSDSPLTEGGVSKFTAGPIFTRPGTGLNVQDLHEVTLIFDREQRLAALEMTIGTGGFGKPGFDRVLGYLKAQYPLKSSTTPMVGNKKAVFETKEARIELMSPHMDFDMTLVYMTKGFYRVFTQAMDAEQKSKSQSEGSRF